MAGKGSRQRTYGPAFESNYDRIFRKDRGDVGSEWVADPDSSPAPQGRSKGFEGEVDQYPREAREAAQKRSQRPSWDVES